MKKGGQVSERKWKCLMYKNLGSFHSLVSDFRRESKMLVNELFCLIAQDTMIS